MGCDIHMMAEYETDKYVSDGEVQVSLGFSQPNGHFEPSGEWKAIKDPVFEYPYFREDEPVSRHNKRFTHEPYTGRNYALFSILADVRNTRHTANAFDPTMQYEERDSILPLAQPRGVPENASKAWKKYVKDWGSDLHSTSYFTLQELIDFEAVGAFNQIITQRGYVPLRQYLAHKSEGTDIQSWASYASGPSYTEAEWLALSDEERQVHLDQLEVNNGWGAPNIRYAWEDDVRDYFATFLEKTIPALKDNAPRKPHPDWQALWDRPWAEKQAYEGPKFLYDFTRIRIVFGFDN